MGEEFGLDDQPDLVTRIEEEEEMSKATLVVTDRTDVSSHPGQMCPVTSM